MKASMEAGSMVFPEVPTEDPLLMLSPTLELGSDFLALNSKAIQRGRLDSFITHTHKLTHTTYWFSKWLRWLRICL